MILTSTPTRFKYDERLDRPVHHAERNEEGPRHEATAYSMRKILFQARPT